MRSASITSFAAVRLGVARAESNNHRIALFVQAMTIGDRTGLLDLSKRMPGSRLKSKTPGNQGLKNASLAPVNQAWSRKESKD